MRAYERKEEKKKHWHNFDQLWSEFRHFFAFRKLRKVNQRNEIIKISGNVSVKIEKRTSQFRAFSVWFRQVKHTHTHREKESKRKSGNELKFSQNRPQANLEHAPKVRVRVCNCAWERQWRKNDFNLVNFVPNHNYEVKSAKREQKKNPTKRLILLVEVCEVIKCKVRGKKTTINLSTRNLVSEERTKRYRNDVIRIFCWIWE